MTNEKKNMISPSMTTSSGSTQISLQNCSIASGPSTSGSSAVVYCLNQLRQRLLLNPSSTLFVRLELFPNRTNIRKIIYISQLLATLGLRRLYSSSVCLVVKTRLTFPVHPCNRYNILTCKFFFKYQHTHERSGRGRKRELKIVEQPRLCTSTSIVEKLSQRIVNRVKILLNAIVD